MSAGVSNTSFHDEEATTLETKSKECVSLSPGIAEDENQSSCRHEHGSGHCLAHGTTNSQLGHCNHCPHVVEPGCPVVDHGTEDIVVCDHSTVIRSHVCPLETDHSPHVCRPSAPHSLKALSTSITPYCSHPPVDIHVPHYAHIRPPSEVVSQNASRSPLYGTRLNSDDFDSSTKATQFPPNIRQLPESLLSKKAQLSNLSRDVDETKPTEGWFGSRFPKPSIDSPVDSHDTISTGPRISVDTEKFPKKDDPLVEIAIAPAPSFVIEIKSKANLNGQPPTPYPTNYSKYSRNKKEESSPLPRRYSSDDECADNGNADCTPQQRFERRSGRLGQRAGFPGHIHQQHTSEPWEQIPKMVLGGVINYGSTDDPTGQDRSIKMTTKYSKHHRVNGGKKFSDEGHYHYTAPNPIPKRKAKGEPDDAPQRYKVFADDSDVEDPPSDDASVMEYLSFHVNQFITNAFSCIGPRRRSRVRYPIIYCPTNNSQLPSCCSDPSLDKSANYMSPQCSEIKVAKFTNIKSGTLLTKRKSIAASKDYDAESKAWENLQRCTNIPNSPLLAPMCLPVYRDKSVKEKIGNTSIKMSPGQTNCCSPGRTDVAQDDSTCHSEIGKGGSNELVHRTADLMIKAFRKQDQTIDDMFASKQGQECTHLRNALIKKVSKVWTKSCSSPWPKVNSIPQMLPNVDAKKVGSRPKSICKNSRDGSAPKKRTKKEKLSRRLKRSFLAINPKIRNVRRKDNTTDSNQDCDLYSSDEEVSLLPPEIKCKSPKKISKSTTKLKVSKRREIYETKRSVLDVSSSTRKFNSPKNKQRSESSRGRSRLGREGQGRLPGLGVRRKGEDKSSS